jgi:ABC-type lipoprotein export system ATPase subunit
MTTTTDTTNQATTANTYELVGVERSYSKGGVTVDALRGIDLTIKNGEMIALEGPSGSGKSTLLQLLGALDVPTKGIVRFAGRELERSSDSELTKIRNEEIGFVFQQFNLIPTLTAEENVAIAMVPRHLDRSTRLARGVELLNQVGLGHRLGHLPSRLSGGEQQRVAIVRALANDPKVLLADEPTGNLDHATGDSVMAALIEMTRATGLAALIATHNLDLARRLDRIVVLEDGKLKPG